MKINFQALFQTPLTKVRFFFIYGNEPSVFERVIAHVHKRTSSVLKIREEADILTKPFSQPSLFGDQEGPSLTLTPRVTDKILKVLDQLEGIYIFTSEKARAKSKLVMAFSEMPNALAIPAYASPMTPAEFKFLIQDLSLPPAFSELLFKGYQNDYHGLIETLAKIKLYGDVSSVDPDLFLTTNSDHGDISRVQKVFLLKDSKQALEGCSRIPASDYIPMLRALGRTFLTLLDLVSLQKTNKPILWHTLSPPVFFKEQPFYERALKLWKKEEIQGMVETLLDLEGRLKFSGATPSIISHILCQRLKTASPSSTA